jgi:hypothetical protein
MHELSICGRIGIEVYHLEGIGLAMALHCGNVGQALCRCLHSQLGGRIKRWIGLQQ